MKRDEAMFKLPPATALRLPGAALNHSEIPARLEMTSQLVGQLVTWPS
jgi:hypothetical protein